MSSSNDRKMLHDLISDAYRRAPWGTDVFEYVADAILTKFLPGYTERVKADALDEVATAHQERYGQRVAEITLSTPESRWLHARADVIRGRRES